MINIETDQFGRTYQIWKQQQLNSCGIACMWMARSIARQMSFAEEEWELAARLFGAAVGSAAAQIGADPHAGMTIDPRAVPTGQATMVSAVATTGFRYGQIAAALRGDGLVADVNGFDYHHRHILDRKIAFNKPGIALVAWPPRTPGGPITGHFVVIGRCTSRHVTFLDPWDGHHNVQYNNGRYAAPYGPTGTIVAVINVSA